MADAFINRQPDISFIEVHPENYVKRGGRYTANLKRAMAHYPVLTHGLTLSFGSTEPHDADFLRTTRDFLRDMDTPWHSDHLCFGGATFHGQSPTFAHDLLPLPFTEEALNTIEARFVEMRQALDVELAFENVSYYAPQSSDPLDEARFCAELVERTGGKLMLDVNNVFVNSQNHSFEPRAFIDLLPLGSVVQMHVAGHLIRDDGLRIDTHGEAVCDEVFELLRYTLGKTGPMPVLLERDNNIPDLDTLLAEVGQLKTIYEDAIATYEKRELQEARL